MGILLLLVLFVLGSSFAIANYVFTRQKKAGNEPWLPAVITFVLALAILAGITLFILSYFIRFER